MHGSLMLDIDGTYLTAEDRQILRQPQVCGVILFARNIAHPQQVRELCRAIRAVRSDLLIGVDQEGGRVQRLRQGFVKLRRPWVCCKLQRIQPILRKSAAG